MLPPLVKSAVKNRRRLWYLGDAVMGRWVEVLSGKQARLH